MPASPAPDPGLLGRNGERISEAAYTKLSYGLISGSGSTRPPGSFLVSSTKRCSSSSALEHALSAAYTHARTAQVTRNPIRFESLCMGASACRLRAVSDVLFLVCLAGGNLILIHIAVGLRRELERQLVVGVLVIGLDVDVMQRDDARQRRDAAHELPELVVAAAEADLDGQLCVKVLLLLGLGLEQLLLQTD